MVDPGPTIPSNNASITPLGYIGMSTSSTFAFVATQVSTVSASTTSAGGTGSLGGASGGGGGGSLRGVSGGGGASSPPLPPLPANPVLNTILQNMAQLQLQFTNIASASCQSFMLAYYRKSPLDITILNTIPPPTTESLTFDRFNGDGDSSVHIDSFMTMCSDYHNLDFVLLKLLSWSLKGTAL